jgi:hypothetical protein
MQIPSLDATDYPDRTLAIHQLPRRGQIKVLEVAGLPLSYRKSTFSPAAQAALAGGVEVISVHYRLGSQKAPYCVPLFRN